MISFVTPHTAPNNKTIILHLTLAGMKSSLDKTEHFMNPF